MVKFIMPKVCKRCWKRNGFSKVSSEFLENEKECKLCNGCFLDLNETADRIIKELDSIPGIRTFSIGTSIPKESEAIEEKIWDFADFRKWRSIKPELNTELGRIIEKKTKYRFSPDPDVRIVYDIKNKKISRNISSVYIYGRYNKLQRGIRQTKKEDAKEESVEGIIENVLIKEIGTEKSKAILHGSGREDIDVLMLGDGRPFVMEVTNPSKRVLSEKEIKRINSLINKTNEGKIKVEFERVVDKEWVEIIKRAKFDKEYEAIVNLETPIEKNELAKLPKSVLLMQRTPKRVLIRRSDLIRKRRIKLLEPEWIDSHTIKLRILSESGTYIKEFISGDEGRTQPSISSLLKTKATCKQLNVVSIHSEWLDNFW